MTDFVHLHAHSQYSVLDGLCSPHELLSAAKDLGQTSLAITDHGTLAGHRTMQQAAQELGLKPILGLEAYISETDRFDRRAVKTRDDNTQAYNHIILLAKHQEGLKNLNKLSELAWTEGFYSKPRMDLELLDEYGDGLIVLSGCMNGLIAKNIERKNFEQVEKITRWFKNRFDEDFYMEIQPHNPPELNHALLAYADKYSISPVVTSDCHFATEDQRATEEAFLILSTKPKYSKEEDFSFAKSRQFKDIFERYNYLYPDRPISFEKLDVFVQGRLDVATTLENQGITRTDVFENTVKIADEIGEYEYKAKQNLLPVPKRSAPERLREMCLEGMAKRGFADNPEYMKRLDMELALIKKKDFAAYFLIIADMVQWAKAQGILVGPGRGSAVGSLVCYVTGITEVDPIKYHLLFARFLDEERNDFPDIDVDFQDSRRGEVKDYLKQKFKNVASISTYAYFADNGAIRAAARVFMVPMNDVNAVLKTVDRFEDFEAAESTRDFRREYPEVLDLARKLRGRITSIGMHASGVVVAKKPVANYAPIETRSDTKDKLAPRLQVISSDMVEAEDIGLIKMDLLGLKTLSVIHDTLEMIKDRRGKVINLLDIPLDDAAVYGDLSNGFTQGIFQCENPAYTDLLIKMGVSNFEDLIASNALVRPGAMNTVGVDYVARKQGRAATQYVHDVMKPYLESTYGVVIYQEQVMQACAYLAGMSWSDADKVRKIIGKKKDVKEFDAFKDKFVTGASEKISPEAAEKLWHDFEAHAGYSFNRSHAVAYSLVSYWTAWIKHHYPIEFMYAALRYEDPSQKGNKITDYLLECKRLGLRMLLPHVNESEIGFSLQGEAIRFGLQNVKYISDNIGGKIIAGRPYKSYEHFVNYATAKGSGINTKAIQSLNAIGGASFTDNPRTGKESLNYYEYLNIPEFDTSALTPKISSQVQNLGDYTEKGVFILMGMVKDIKRGVGWSRVEVVDATGRAGIFHNETTQIEAGKMYLMLVGDNRIHRYLKVDEITDTKDDTFLRYLNAKAIPCAENEYAVIDFSSMTTKKKTKMAHVILSDKDKELRKVLVFSKNYPLALGKLRPGTIVRLALGKLDDGAVYVKDIK